MAEVFKRVNGRKIEKIIAQHEIVQWSLGQHRDVIAQRARAVLNAAKDRTGDAQILTEDGDVDKYVVLDDSRGLGAAMSIEFGRGPDTTSPWGPMEPVAPLRIAASIPIDKRSIGPRMKNGRFRKKRR